MLTYILLFILFIITGGAIANERFRKNRAALMLASLVALAGAYYLTRQIVADVVERRLGASSSEVRQNSAAAPDPKAIEVAYWHSIIESEDVGSYEAYLEKYPNGEFASLARARIAELQARETRRQVEAERLEAQKREEEQRKAAEVEADRLRAEQVKAERALLEQQAVEKRRVRESLLQSIKPTGVGSVVIYPKCSNCAYTGYLYNATVTLYVDNESNISARLAVLAYSLNIGSCSGNQFNTRGLVALEDGRPMASESFTTLLPGARVAVTTNLNERCLAPLLNASATDVSIVLLLLHEEEILRVPILVRGVPVRQTR